jgi:cytochrome c-type biogenesis protein CcmH/NrfG
MLRKVWVSSFLLTVFLLPAQQPQFRQLYVSGKVVLPDGSPPPVPVLIELWCEEQRQPQFYTDRKGQFNIPLGGDRTRTVADARRSLPGDAVGASGPDRSHVSLMNCELEARLSGFASTKINLGRRSVFESSDVGTIILRPLAKGEGSFISMNTLSAPPKARKAFEKAQKELTKKKPNPEKAVKELQKAVEIYPEFAAAWNLLGRQRTSMKDLAGARQAFQKAMESDPKFVPPCLALALMEMKQQKMAEAVKLTGRVLELLPELPEANYYHAIAHISLGDFNTAETSIRMVQKSAEANKYPRTHFMLGSILAQKGDIPQAAAELRRFLEVESSSRPAEAARQQLAQWEAEGKLK